MNELKEMTNGDLVEKALQIEISPNEMISIQTELLTRLEGRKKLILSKEKQQEFEKATEPMIKFLCENCHPHVSVIVDCDTAELLEGVCAITTDKFIKD
ncbi:MAG: hypothetical protein PHU71_07110 [Candidatus Gracilibacteria bacterium]|nr:hypothetical protein [Candidatus Gracilibacteria bacterium]